MNENENIENTQKEKRSLGRNFKLGMYSSILAVAVIAIVVLLNLFVGQLNIKVDLTTEKVYTLTEDTAKIADELSDEITIYYLAKEDEEYKVLKNVIDQYDKLPHISVVYKDPDLYPQFASQYTNEELKGNDVVVVDESTGTSRFIPFDEMYISDYAVDYSSYDYSYTYTLDAEGRITSAIQYITAEEHTKMYAVSAHGETPLGEKVQNLVDKANIDTADFNALSESAIPEDCDILFINGPTSDISEAELAMYKDYLDNGGKAILSAAYTPNDLPNYNNLLSYYGVEVAEGVVYEAEGNYLQTYPWSLVNNFANVTADISSNFSMEEYVISPASKGLKLQDASSLRSTLTTNSIISTSDGAYSKIDPNSESIQKEDGDIEGPFDVVIQASDTYKDKASKVVILASQNITADDWVDQFSCSNIDMFIDCIDWMSEGTTESVAIPQRSLDQAYLQVPDGDATMWAIIAVAVIPLGILIAGFVVWFLRRRR